MLENKTNLQTRLQLVKNELESLKQVASRGGAYTDYLTIISRMLDEYNPEVNVEEKLLNLKIKKVLTDMEYSHYFIGEVVAEGTYHGADYPMQALYDFRKAAYTLNEAMNDGPFVDAVNAECEKYPFSKSFDEWVPQDLESWVAAVSEEYTDSQRGLLNDAEERGWSEFNTGGGCMVWYKNIHCKDNQVRAVGVNSESVVLYHVTSERVGESADDEWFAMSTDYKCCDSVISKRQFKEICNTQQDFCDYYDIGNVWKVFEPVDIKQISSDKLKDFNKR